MLYCLSAINNLHYMPWLRMTLSHCKIIVMHSHLWFVILLQQIQMFTSEWAEDLRLIWIENIPKCIDIVTWLGVFLVVLWLKRSISIFVEFFWGVIYHFCYDDVMYCHNSVATLEAFPLLKSKECIRHLPNVSEVYKYDGNELFSLLGLHF